MQISLRCHTSLMVCSLIIHNSRSIDFTKITIIYIEFTNVWETAFDVTDQTFDCNVNRTKGDSSTQLYLINHFLDEVVNVVATSIAPDKDLLNETNAVSGTGRRGLRSPILPAIPGK